MNTKTDNTIIWTKTPVILAAAFFATFLWGSAFPSIKVGYSLMNIASGDSASQMLFAGIRFFFAGAAEVEVDKQGRILIPSNLREYAGIEKEVVSVGVNTKVEIWSKERYATMETGFEEMDDIMEQLSEMGIQL